ncbi:MAG TPA: FAD:protein FMN transferase [Candidatus Binatia bacterium]|jgi:thiamine biosynthesis lipoprotein
MNLAPWRAVDGAAARGLARAAFVATATLFAISSCATLAGAAVARQGQVVMGTVLTVTVVANDRDEAESLAAASIDEARRWDEALTIWRESGELARLNRAAGSGDIAVGSRLRFGLASMLEYAAETSGAFEPEVAILPDRGDPATVLRGIAHTLHLSPSTASLEKGSALDPGAIGKGLALDAIVEMLEAHGIGSAFLDFGGSSQTAVGVSPGDPRGWTVAVASLGATPHGVLRLRDESVSTSVAGAADTKPILDPRSRMPVPAPRLATVRCRSAAAADAWSTALVVLGPGGMAAARARSVESLVEGGSGTAVSPGMGLIRGKPREKHAGKD